MRELQITFQRFTQLMKRIDYIESLCFKEITFQKKESLQKNRTINLLKSEIRFLRRKLLNTKESEGE